MGTTKKDCKFCKYVWNVLIAIDQLCNTVIAGDPDETMSSRFGKWASKNYTNPVEKHKRYVACFICWFLDKIEKDHCKKSIEKDEGSNDLLNR